MASLLQNKTRIYLFVIFVQKRCETDESCDMFLFAKKYFMIPTIKQNQSSVKTMVVITNHYHSCSQSENKLAV